MKSNSNRHLASQSGFTLIELMIVIAVIGILAAVATISYQVQVRKTHLVTVYQELNHYRIPYQVLVADSAQVTNFSLNGLNMPAQTKYCQFSVVAPTVTGSTPNAIHCQIQNLGYLQNQHLSLDRAANGSWHCRASADIAKAYLPQACQ